jgi:hypothetical protein
MEVCYLGGRALRKVVVRFFGGGWCSLARKVGIVLLGMCPILFEKVPRFVFGSIGGVW